LKELLALDKQLANEKALKDFRTASHNVGKRQLNRMRLLKDLRVVQRYRDAVNAGEAFGWHTLVYGLVLSTYSLPLRQGLLHYGRQTLGGFIYSAARPLELRESTCQELQHEITLSLPPLIQQTLTPKNGCCIKVLS
jgi:urease accessory protein UreF